MPVRVPSPGPDRSEFARLLERLDTDPVEAGHRYEALRYTLLRFFEWRGVAAADSAADETLDRLGRRLAAGETVADPRAYALGIARLVALEQHRRPEARHTSLDDVPAWRLTAAEGEGADPPRLRCFDRCLGALPAGQHDFIVRYYAATGRARIDGRAALATELGLSPNALRLRAQRLRDGLESCIRACLGSTRTFDDGSPA
jgi:DNA-directed RNA polymerase specialized sigma24 family protein